MIIFYDLVQQSIGTNYEKSEKLYDCCGHYITHAGFVKFLDCLEESGNSSALHILDPGRLTKPDPDVTIPEPIHINISAEKQVNKFVSIYFQLICIQRDEPLQRNYFIGFSLQRSISREMLPRELCSNFVEDELAKAGIFYNARKVLGIGRFSCVYDGNIHSFYLSHRFRDPL
jgi:hypothetical protein